MQDDAMVQQLPENNNIYNIKSEGVLIQTSYNTKVTNS